MLSTLRCTAFFAVILAFAYAASASAKSSTVVYDSFSSSGADYNTKWGAPYGPGEGTTSFAGNKFNVTATPFTTGYDYSVFDHLKYIRISNAAFPVPKAGAVTFESDIQAATPGTVDGLTQQGVYGPSGTWTDPNLKPVGFTDYSAPVFEGQQAGAVMNMIDFCTGQLFDWFISGHYAFALIERLPTNVTGNTSNPNCPGATYVGPSKMYTQIIKNVPVAAGVPHHVAITFSRSGGPEANVVYALDGKDFAKVEHVGIPVDKQGGVKFTGTYPSLGPGERLGEQINAVAIGHGLFSLIDAFPYQHPDASALDVSIPVGTGNPADAGKARLFGQGADASFDNFVVTTKN